MLFKCNKARLKLNIIKIRIDLSSVSLFTLTKYSCHENARATMYRIMINSDVLLYYWLNVPTITL